MYAHTNHQIVNAEQAEADMWSQSFARNLDVYTSDHYNTRNMTEDEFAEFLSWIMAHGWRVDEPVSRGYVCAEPDTLPARQWNHIVVKETVVAPRQHRKDSNFPVARFCREGHACAKADCRYVHGDTIARLNRPCQFGQSCGETDPTGLKRSQCLHMHTGEAWFAGMVIQRPQVQV